MTKYDTHKIVLSRRTGGEWSWAIMERRPGKAVRWKWTTLHKRSPSTYRSPAEALADATTALYVQGKAGI